VASEPKALRLRLTEESRDFVVDNPGSVVKVRERMRYSDGFRAFVIEKMESHECGAQLSRAQAARAFGIPLHTLNAWLSMGRRRLVLGPRNVSNLSEPAPDCTATWSSDVERIKAMWDQWQGNLSGFCEAVREQGIEMSRNHINQVLLATGRRERKSRSRHRMDEEAVRGALERFFPGAQVSADGKYVDITLNGQRHRFCWQPMTDMATGGVVGMSLGDQETSEGLLDAYEQAKHSLGDKPAAALTDNRSANVSKAVLQKLKQDGVFAMTSRKGRPQTNGTTEGGFGHFAQSMPDIDIEADSQRELARKILWYILFAYAAGRNMTPRRNLKNLTPAEAIQQHARRENPKTEEEQRRQALERLAVLNKRAKRARHNRNREAPAVRQLMTEVLRDLKVPNPRNGTLNKLATLGIEACTEAAGIVQAKREAGLEFDGDPERYLLKIAINLANRNEDLRAFANTVRLRQKAGELLLTELEEQADSLKESLAPDDFTQNTALRAFDASTRVDRHFWWTHSINSLKQLPDSDQPTIARSIARRVATRYSIHYKERDRLIGQLAQAITPLGTGV